LWALLFPSRRQRTAITFPGLILIALAMSIGTAAYNTASNILFLTLSLLLSCLVLSGVMSWLNFRRLGWRLQVESPMRVGMNHPVAVEVRNNKTVLPAYGLWFEVTSSSLDEGACLPLRERLDPQGECRIEWSISPRKRGLEVIELHDVGSLFPFGFLRKSLSTSVRREILVWPAPVEYRRAPVAAWQHFQHGEAMARQGQGSDLYSLRRYQVGDSHRQIHWKASARLRHLMVRQFAAESEEGFSIWLRTPADVWTRPDQFELLCSFVATLAEDLFKAGKLHSASVNRGPFIVVRRLRDLEAFLDQLAIVQPETDEDRPPVESEPVLAMTPDAASESPSRPRLSGARRKRLTFVPDGARGVSAYVNGEKAASA
jgi:uncharacterized protein (DUF58 family)